MSKIEDESASRPQPARDERETGGGPSLDEHLGVFFRESTLWPVLIVVVASLGSFGAALLVLAFVDRNPFAAGALLLLAGMSADVGWRARRQPGLRRLALGAGVLWVVALALAATAVFFGIA